MKNEDISNVSEILIKMILDTSDDIDVHIMGELVSKHTLVGKTLSNEIDKYMISERPLRKEERKDARELLTKLDKIIEILK